LERVEKLVEDKKKNLVKYDETRKNKEEKE